MSEHEASRIAREEMKSGHNCCQAVLLAASQVWNMPITEDVLAAASLFGGGIGSGCTCGALAGMVMASGIRQKSEPHPQGEKLAQHLHDEFKQNFGATCCRAIKKKRSGLQNIGNRACVDLTGQTAAILIKEWEVGQV